MISSTRSCLEEMSTRWLGTLVTRPVAATTAPVIVTVARVTAAMAGAHADSRGEVRITTSSGDVRWFELRKTALLTFLLDPVAFDFVLQPHQQFAFVIGGVRESFVA